MRDEQLAAAACMEQQQRQEQEQQNQQSQLPPSKAPDTKLSGRADAGGGLSISLQQLGPAVLRQSWAMLQGQQQHGDDDDDDADGSVDIVVSGQLHLQRSPKHRIPSPSQPQQTGSSSSSNAIKRFDKQLEATRAAVAAAAATAARAPLQGVLKEMQSMIAHMEAVCCTGGSESASHNATPREGHEQPHCQSAWQEHAAAGRRNGAPAKGCSSSSPQDWHQQPCDSAYVRHSPRSRRLAANQGGSKPRSPDRHKLRGRLHQVQDRLSKLEVS